MRKRIVRRKRSKSERRGNRLLNLSCIAKGADEAVVSFHTMLVGTDSGTKRSRSLARAAIGQQIHAIFQQCFSGLMHLFIE